MRKLKKCSESVSPAGWAIPDSRSRGYRMIVPLWQYE
jgi:hypothetical protein